MSSVAAPAPAPTPVPSATTIQTAPPRPNAKKSQPFWLGGLASMGAACASHPLDLLKVRLQLAACTPTAALATAAAHSTSSGAAAAPLPLPASQRESLPRLVVNILRNEGVLSLYSGLSASLLRQATYSTVRFGTYESLKERRLHQLQSSSSSSRSLPPTLPMRESVAFSLLSGALGGVAGNPADLCNVRMQNDKKLPLHQRRNYAHVFDGLIRITRNDGVLALWGGVGPNVCRAMLMTAGQLASYDFFKDFIVQRRGPESAKHVSTHLAASCLAGVVATVATQPADVIKSRLMNAEKAKASATPAGVTAVSSSTSSIQALRTMIAHEGWGSLYRGFVPALIRLGPHTIATFILLEQLKRITGCA